DQHGGKTESVQAEDNSNETTTGRPRADGAQGEENKQAGDRDEIQLPSSCKGAVEVEEEPP
ncbi:unnamed protein product, partial [Amoebophrya sp. A120]